MERELKKCPFCGSGSVRMDFNVSRFGNCYYFVRCDVCGARTRGEAIAQDERGDEWQNPAADKSAACWNQRAVTD